VPTFCSVPNPVIDVPSAEIAVACSSVQPFRSKPMVGKYVCKSTIPSAGVQRNARSSPPEIMLVPTTLEPSPLTPYAMDRLPPARTPSDSNAAQPVISQRTARSCEEGFPPLYPTTALPSPLTPWAIA